MEDIDDYVEEIIYNDKVENVIEISEPEYSDDEMLEDIVEEIIIVKNNYTPDLCNICDDPMVNNICPMLNIYNCPICKSHCSIEMTLSKCKKC